MKRVISCVLFLLFCSCSLLGQSDWTKKVNFPGSARSYDVAFSIGHYGFVGVGWCSGNNYYTDFYKYDTHTNTWSPIANYPGNGQYGCSACTIEGKGYVGLGWDNANFKDFWSYDTNTNTWTQMASFPGKARYSTFPFVIGHKAYFVAGSPNGPPYFYDVWVYDAHQNTWTQLKNYPETGGVESAIAFSIGNHGYEGDGYYNPGCYTKMYEYDTASDTWTTIAPIPAAYGVGGNPGVFCLGSRAYVASGAQCTSTGLRDGWTYDTVTKSWCEFSYLAGSKLSTGYGVAFAADNHGYISTGFDTNRVCLNDLWEYTPVFKINVTDTSIACTNDSVKFSDSTSYIVSSWSWSFPGGSPSSSNLQYPDIYYSHSGTYTVTLIITACGGPDTVSKTINVIAGNINSVAINVTTNEQCYGNCIGSATANVIGGSSPYTYSWAPSGETTDVATGLCAGTITVTVKDMNGCSATATATITAPPEIIATDTIDNIPCKGQLASARINVSGGTSPYTYLWNPGKQTTSNVTGLNVGTYTIGITDIIGCTGSTSIVITQPSQLTSTISSLNNILCYGGTGSATVTAGGGTAPYSYSWTNPGGTNATETGLKPGTYTVTVTDLNGCTATATATITQPPLLSITTSAIHASCNLPNGSATATAGGGTGTYTYSWSPSNQTTATITGLSVGTYSITVTDNNQCTASSTVSITQPTTTSVNISSVKNVSCFNGNDGIATATASGGVNPYTYLWTPGGGTNASASGLFALTYTVKAADALGCIATASVTLTEPLQLLASISEPKIICKDSTGNLIAGATGGTPPYKYAWSSGSTSGIATITATGTNNYSVIVTDANGCTASADIILQYGPSFAVEIDGKKSVCVGASTTLCANAIGAIDGVSYLWQPVNTTNNCITVVPTGSSMYTVTVVDGCGSTTTAALSVSANPSPAISMYADFDQGCAPLCIQFRNYTTISQGGIRQYVWTFGNGDTSSAKNPIYCYPSNGEYNITLTAISDSGCSATLDKINMITVYSKPNASFTYAPQPVTILNPTVQFTDNSSDIYGIAFRWWSFGDGESLSPQTSIINPVYTYQDTGFYCPQLVVENNKGCIDTATNCIFISPLYTLYIPSAFSPNEDGVNDIFAAKGTYIKSFEMYVFDRWGMQLFHSTDINKGWDGTLHGNGVISQEDSYVYIITATDWNNTQHNYTGEVTLLK